MCSQFFILYMSSLWSTMSKHLHHAACGFSFTPIPAEPLSSSQQKSVAYDVQQSTAYAPGFNPGHKQRNSSTPNTTTNIPPVQISTETFKSESVDLSPDAVRSLLADFEPINLTGIQDSPPRPPTNPSVPPVTNPYVKKVTNPYVTKVTNKPYVKVTHPLDAFSSSYHLKTRRRYQQTIVLFLLFLSLAVTSLSQLLSLTFRKWPRYMILQAQAQVHQVQAALHTLEQAGVQLILYPCLIHSVSV